MSTIDPINVEGSFKKITSEAFSLEPDALVTLFEIDVSDLNENTLSGNSIPIADNILRFHNLNFLQGRTLWFQGNQYYAVPVIAEGFELSSSGELPRPKLSLTTVEGMGDTAVAQLASLKRAFISLGNLVGAKVTRIRTFYKFLDNINFDSSGGAATYTSDFTASEDGWAVSNGTLKYNAGLSWDGSPSLRLKGNGAESSHRIYREILTVGKKYRVTGAFYAAPGSENCNGSPSIVAGIYIYDGWGNELGSSSTINAWESFDIEFTAKSGGGAGELNFYARNVTGGPTLFMCDTDHIYFRDIVVTEHNPNVLPSPVGGSLQPDQNAQFPKEHFFIENKSLEDKHSVQFELSSVLDVQNFKLPGRLVLSTRCPWVYRGEGCCFEFKGDTADQLKKQKEIFGATEHLPDFAPPIANANDELISDEISTYSSDNIQNPATCSIGSINCPVEYNKNNTYPRAKVVYLEKNGIKYYFVSKGNTPIDSSTDVPKGIAPPHSLYWEPDQCSKTIGGCKLRWGTTGAAKNCTGTNCSGKTYTNSLLPFGGFPGTNTKTSVV